MADPEGPWPTTEMVIAAIRSSWNDDTLAAFQMASATEHDKIVRYAPLVKVEPLPE